MIYSALKILGVIHFFWVAISLTSILNMSHYSLNVMSPNMKRGKYTAYQMHSIKRTGHFKIEGCRFHLVSSNF